MTIIREIVPGTSISIELSPAELYSAYEEQKQLYLREDAETALEEVLQDLGCDEDVEEKMFPDDKVREQFFACVIEREEKYADAGVSIDFIWRDATTSALQSIMYPIYKDQLLGSWVKEKDMPGPDDMEAVMKMMADHGLFW